MALWILEGKGLGSRKERGSAVGGKGARQQEGKGLSSRRERGSAVGGKGARQ